MSISLNSRNFLCISSNSCNLLRISSNSRNFLHIYTVQLLYTVKEKVGKPDKNYFPFPMVSEIHTETSSLRNLKIMPRILNKSVRSWIRLQISSSFNILSLLKVPECEIFYLFDSRQFYTIKVPWKGDPGTKVTNSKNSRFGHNFVFFCEKFCFVHCDMR